MIFRQCTIGGVAYSRGKPDPPTYDDGANIDEDEDDLKSKSRLTWETKKMRKVLRSPSSSNMPQAHLTASTILFSKARAHSAEKATTMTRHRTSTTTSLSAISTRLWTRNRALRTLHKRFTILSAYESVPHIRCGLDRSPFVG
jgi:hypothetical protein